MRLQVQLVRCGTSERNEVKCGCCYAAHVRTILLAASVFTI